MKSAAVVLGRFEGHGQPGRDLKADHAGGEKILAARAYLLCHGERRGKDRHAQMNRAGLMGVVQFQAVGGRTVGQGRIREVRLLRPAQDRSLPRRGQTVRQAVERLAGIGQRAPHRNTEIVEKEVFGPIDHLDRQAVVIEPGTECGQMLGQRNFHHLVLSLPLGEGRGEGP